MLLFGNLVDTLFRGFCAYGLDVPSTIIIDDSWDLGGPTDVFIGWKTTTRWD
jgi:hypothetical protein